MNSDRFGMVNYSADVKHGLLFATSRLIIGWYQVASIISPGQIPSWLWTGDGTLGHYAILVNAGSDFGMDIHIPYIKYCIKKMGSQLKLRIEWIEFPRIS